MCNTALSCLATTDAVTGVVGQPFYIAQLTLFLQGEVSSTHCSLITLSKNVIRVLGLTSLLHLSLVNIERYIAIKHSLEHISMVTTVRIYRSSAIMWFVSLLITTPLATIDNSLYLTVSNVVLSLCTVIIIFCQVVLYHETRRHEKEIAAQQASVEARQKFLKDKKAFKLTTIVLLFLVLSYLPFLIFRMLIVNNIIDSVNVAYIVLTTTTFVIILNSLINPIIYCIRIRQFRVAFIEIIFIKSNVQAEGIEMRVFGTLNVVVPLAAGQENEGQNNEQEKENNSSNNNSSDENSINNNSQDNNNGDNNNNNSDNKGDNNNNSDNDNNNSDNNIGDNNSDNNNGDNNNNSDNNIGDNNSDNNIGNNNSDNNNGDNYSYNSNNNNADHDNDNIDSNIDNNNGDNNSSNDDNNNSDKNDNDNSSNNNNNNGNRYV